jgi:hypothetical protein
MDSVVLSWLHDTITVELQDIIHDQTDTGRQSWLVLEEQFLGKRGRTGPPPRRLVPSVLSGRSLRGGVLPQDEGHGRLPP